MVLCRALLFNFLIIDMRSKLPVYSKYAVIFLFLLLVAVMIVATVVEKISGTDFVVENIYSSPLFILLSNYSKLILHI